MKSIYCAGPTGNVGWVSSWDFDQTDRTKVVRVHLTLNHLKAHRFGRSDEDIEIIYDVLQHIRKHEGTYGSYAVFTGEEL